LYYLLQSIFYNDLTQPLLFNYILRHRADAYVIHQAPILYQVALLGDFVGVPEYTWYSAVIVYFAMAAICGGIYLVISPKKQAD